jgi:hypothetical protein
MKLPNATTMAMAKIDVSFMMDLKNWFWMMENAKQDKNLSGCGMKLLCDKRCFYIKQPGKFMNNFIDV